jgi:hypothetical protein
MFKNYTVPLVKAETDRCERGGVKRESTEYLKLSLIESLCEPPWYWYFFRPWFIGKNLSHAKVLRYLPSRLHSIAWKQRR